MAKCCYKGRHWLNTSIYFYLTKLKAQPQKRQIKYPPIIIHSIGVAFHHTNGQFFENVQGLNGHSLEKAPVYAQNSDLVSRG